MRLDHFPAGTEADFIRAGLRHFPDAHLCLAIGQYAVAQLADGRRFTFAVHQAFDKARVLRGRGVDQVGGDELSGNLGLQPLAIFIGGLRDVAVHPGTMRVGGVSHPRGIEDEGLRKALEGFARLLFGKTQ